MTIDLKHTFVTSDHHFGSFKLPGFLKVFTEEQEKELIDKWNRTVGKDDLVYYNGDFCDGNVVELCNYAKQLNGRIILIRGNHEMFDDAIYKAVFKELIVLPPQIFKASSFDISPLITLERISSV